MKLSSTITAGAKKAAKPKAKKKASVKKAASSGGVVASVVMGIRERATAKQKKDKLSTDVNGPVDAMTATEFIDDDKSAQFRLSRVECYNSCGLPNVDTIFGNGLPEGQFIEVFGPESSGKSAWCDLICKSVQEQGGEAMVLEFEQSRSLKRLRRQGFIPHPDRYGIVWPEHAEQAWKAVRTLLRAAIHKYRNQKERPPIVVIWDSIGSTFTRDEIEYDEKRQKGDEFKAEQPANVARVMAREIRRATKLMRQARCTVIFVNHERDDFAARGPFKRKRTPGGSQIKYNTIARVRFFAIKWPFQGKKKEGLRVYMTTVKSKLIDPGMKSSFILNFKRGPSPEHTAWVVLKEAKALKPGKVAGTYNSEWGNGIKRKDFLERMRGDDADFKKQVWDRVIAHERSMSEDDE